MNWKMWDPPAAFDTFLSRFLSYRSMTVTGTPRLGDDVGHLLDLPLGTAEGTELLNVSIRYAAVGILALE